ncbi:thioesterase family protein [Aliamphritea spongicola]|nr:thioesterase family protein [Aliamphritea spongicola]
MDNEIYLTREYQRYAEGTEIGAPLQLYRCEVSPDWVDYNGHMSESFFLFAFGDASDALFRYVGIDEAYRASGNSFIPLKPISITFWKLQKVSRCISPPSYWGWMKSACTFPQHVSR